jgi:phosphoglycerol transferase MdoB-like AlkP superfamily enzyme
MTPTIRIILHLALGFGVSFIALKWLGIIAWSWWWVTAPFWGGFALALVVFVVMCGVMIWQERP